MTPEHPPTAATPTSGAHSPGASSPAVHSSGTTTAPTVVLDVWADLVCPWCYLGWTRVRAAVSAWERPHEVLVRHRAYELDPGMPRGQRLPLLTHLATKLGGGEDTSRQMTDRVTSVAAADGVVLDFGSAVAANSFDGHRLIALARDAGGPALEEAVLGRLFAAHFSEGLVIDDMDVLRRCAAEAGLDEPQATAALAGDDYADVVRADEVSARELGVGGVPFVVANGRIAVSGAQPVDVFTQLLQAALQPATR